jgi:wobble nucleotide-excising tRNase
MAEPKKLICPKCDKETVEGEKCTLCGFSLEGFFNFLDWQDTAEKVRKKRADDKAAAEAAEAANNPPKKKNLLAHLGGK